MGCNPSSPPHPLQMNLLLGSLQMSVQKRAANTANSPSDAFYRMRLLNSTLPPHLTVCSLHLAAAQGLDEAQVNWSMMLWKDANYAIFAAESEREEDKDDKARVLLLLAAAQGCYNAYSPLFDFALDDQEANYWRERQDSFENARLYSVGPRRAQLLWPL